MLMTLPLVQVNEARRERRMPTNQAQIKIKLRQMLESILMIEKNVLPLFKLKFFLNQVVNLHIVII